MNPYETLGVPPNASDYQIKQAYRSRCKATHPDTGADGAEFHQVGIAYGVLRDPERRKLYDETGSIDETAVRVSHQQVLEFLATLFNMAIDVEGKSGQSMKSIDLMKSMRDNAGRLQDEGWAKLAGYQKAIADRETLRSRIIRKDDGQNLFVAALDHQLTHLRQNERTTKNQVEILKRARAELEHYESIVEVVQAVQTFVHGAGMFSNSTATGTSVFRFGA
jgi:curved DNA-binding protein CbpA